MIEPENSVEYLTKKSFFLKESARKLSEKQFAFEQQGFSAIHVFDEQGELIAYILGTLIDVHTEQLIKHQVHFQLTKQEYINTPTLFESELFQYAGSWLCYVLLPSLERIYVDANASLGVVFDPQLKQAASGALRLLSDDAYSARFNRSMYKKLNIADTGWYPCGLTAHDGVFQLLPNHYLDLNRWTAIRHWPKQDSFDIDQSSGVTALEYSTKSVISALVKSGSSTVALTAGRETRFLLSLSREYWSELCFSTVAFPHTRVDQHTASRISAKFDLKHKILPCVESDNADQKRWIFQSNHCASGGANAVFSDSLLPLKDFDYFIGGLGGEVARGFFYRQNDCTDTALDAVSLIRRMGLPAIEPLVSRMHTWLEGLQAFDSFKVLDLAYIEHRMGPWAFAASYVDYPTTQIHPMISRESYTAMMSFSKEIKNNNVLLNLTENKLPELSSFPVNSYGDYRDVIYKILRVRLSLVIKKMRKLFG